MISVLLSLIGYKIQVMEMNSKKVALFLFSAGFFIVYGKSSRAYIPAEGPSITTEIINSVDSWEGSAIDTIDLSKVPVSEQQLEEFPIFNPPANIATLNKPIIRDFDRLFFPTQQGLVLVEGKVYKTFLTTVSGKEWSLAYFEKSYGDLIRAAGGVMLFSGKVSTKELDRVKDEATYFGEEGSIDYPNDVVKVYAIRRKAGDHILIQFSGNSASGAIQILQMPASDKK